MSHVGVNLGFGNLQISGIKNVLGDFQLIVIPSFGGLPYDQATASLELFAKEVMPGARELQG
jgi:hypothetical protein